MPLPDTVSEKEADKAALDKQDRALVARYLASPLAQTVGDVRLENFGQNRRGEKPKARYILGITNCIKIASLLKDKSHD